jgi:hypothetical protein
MADYLAAMRRQFSEHRRWWFAMGGFLAFFLLLLLPVPLSRSLLGSVDTLFIPALGNTVLNRIVSAFSGEFVGSAMYPGGILRYGETAFGTGSVFLLFRFLGANDVFAVYLTQVVLLSLTALTTVILAERLTGSFSSAVLAAFIFTTSNFVWADIDHLPIHAYFLPILSMYFLIRTTEEGNRNLMVAGLLGGAQAYFSLQVYAYQTLMLAVLALFHARKLRKIPGRQKVLAALAYAVIALPLVLFYLYTVIRLHPVDAWPRSSYDAAYSMGLLDFFGHLPGKLLQYPFTHTSAGGWVNVAHSGFPGLLAPILALLGLRGLDRERLVWLTIGLIAFFFTLGTTVDVGGTSLTSPLILFYKYVPLSQYLRVEIRAYSLVLLGMSMLAGFGWRRVSAGLGKWRRGLPGLGLALAFAIVAAENISWPLNVYEKLRYPNVPPGYVQYFKDKPEALILDLPSASTVWPLYIDDAIYVLWQTQHKRNILGGVNGYFPPSRIEVQHLTDELPSAVAFRQFQRLGVTHIIWHKSLHLVCHPPHGDVGCDPETGQRSVLSSEGFDWLNTSAFVHLVYEDDDLKIFELRSLSNTSLDGKASPRSPTSSMVHSCEACTIGQYQ